jgi:hypothetical protein
MYTLASRFFQLNIAKKRLMGHLLYALFTFWLYMKTVAAHFFRLNIAKKMLLGYLFYALLTILIALFILSRLERTGGGIKGGIYRSQDWGKTWKQVNEGLFEGVPAGQAPRIRGLALCEKQPDIVYLSAANSGISRQDTTAWLYGIFKTENGGKSWKKVLYVNEKTGAADLIMDPSNPNKLFAAMWEYRRWPWLFKSGGYGSGLYVTVDGGERWTKLTEEDGLPKGELGRIGLECAAERGQDPVLPVPCSLKQKAFLRPAKNSAVIF